MVHDRRVGESTLTFGNQGALFMRAMTWWDQETGSIWSQPWGRAIDGPLKGTRLDLMPARIVSWGAWLADHPDTLVLDLGSSAYATLQRPINPDHVIGISLGPEARAFPYKLVVREVVLNDNIGEFPVLVMADSDTQNVRAYLRQVGDTVLEFDFDNGRLVDRETGSIWDPVRGIAVEGALRGAVLQQAPYITSYDWAWEDFYPHTTFYPG